MKQLLVTIFLMSFIQQSIAQSLIKFGLTYTIGKEQSLLGKKKDVHHEKNVNSSFGAGVTIDLGYTYLGDNSFGPEGTFSIFLGKPKIIRHNATANSDNKTVVKRKMLFFSPSLFIIGSNGGDVNPYLSSGLLFNVWQNVSKIEYIENDGEKTEKIWKVNYNTGIGYKSKIGISYDGADEIALFAELQYQMISIAYKNELLENYMVNNQDLLSTLPLSERERTYFMSLDNENNMPSNENFKIDQPIAINLIYANHNHFGLSVGSFFKLK